MGRTSKFTQDELLDAALKVIVDDGLAATTIAAISSQLQAPVGSIYHRFRSRDLLLARLWIRSIKRFQEGFLIALAERDDLVAAGTNAALHVVRWSRDHADEARVMLLYRREDLAAKWPAELGDEITQLNANVESAVARFADEHFGNADTETVSRAVFCLIDIPYAATRHALLAGAPPAPYIDELVTTAASAILNSTRADHDQSSRI